MPSKKSKNIDDMPEHELKTEGRALFTPQHVDDHRERILDVVEKLCELSDLKKKNECEAVPPRVREPAQTCPGTTCRSHSSVPGVGGATSSTGVPDSLSEGVWTPVFGDGFGFGDGKGQGKGTKVDPASCAAVEEVHFRYFFVCLGGWAPDGLAGDKCMTMISSDGWRQLFPTVAWTHGQRWYCDCGTRYKGGNGSSLRSGRACKNGLHLAVAKNTNHAYSQSYIASCTARRAHRPAPFAALSWQSAAHS
jgi:hypothetical protein